MLRLQREWLLMGKDMFQSERIRTKPIAMPRCTHRSELQI